LLLDLLLDKMSGMIRRPKHQQGSVYERCGNWYVRFYVTIGAKRVQQSRFLVAKDAKHPTKSCVAVKNLRDAFMTREVNNGSGKLRTSDDDIVTFWEKKYLPFITEHKKPSTVAGYRQIWETHLKFLLKITKTHTRTSLNHIRALISSIFGHAVSLGIIETNMLKGNVKIIGTPKPTPETGFYSLEEAENIISALVDHVDCQLVMALSCFLGLRPGEIQGLKFEDFDDRAVHIRRAVWRGNVGTTKTPESVASLPLIDAVRIPFELWKAKRGNPSEGWLFETINGGPIELRDWASHRIRPILEAKKIAWKGYYAGRRGAGTAVIDLTNGNILAGQELLRHKNANTTTRFYKKVTGVNLTAGLAAMSTQLALPKGE
jgi:integrase